MHRIRITACTALLFAVMTPMPLGAAPQSVYGPSAPGDSAFVRLLNLLPDALRVSLGATRIGPVGSAAISAYEPVVPDIYVVRAGGEEREVVPKSGTYLTIACTSKGIILFDDPPHTNPARAQVFLYNLTSIASLDLKTADGKTAVVAGVKEGESGQVVVNAVTVSLAVYNGAALVKAVGSLALQRGSSYSVFAMGDAARVSLLAAKADVKVE
jgi:alginate O-acetyltransferase complex protein AlgF